eukprot:456214-Pelagomonas_calceolata.AAC.7
MQHAGTQVHTFYAVHACGNCTCQQIVLGLGQSGCRKSEEQSANGKVASTGKSKTCYFDS